MALKKREKKKGREVEEALSPSFVITIIIN